MVSAPILIGTSVEFGRVGGQRLDFQPPVIGLHPFLDFLFLVVGGVVVNVNHLPSRPIKARGHPALQEIDIRAPIENLIGTVNKGRIINFHTAKNFGRLPRSCHRCHGRNRMDAKRAVENRIFFRWIFFDTFAENSSSFFSGLTFLAAGFSSVLWLRFPILVPFYFGTDEAAATPTQVLALQGTFSSRLPGWTTPVLLPQTRLPQG